MRDDATILPCKTLAINVERFRKLNIANRGRERFGALFRSLYLNFLASQIPLGDIAERIRQKFSISCGGTSCELLETDWNSIILLK